MGQKFVRVELPGVMVLWLGESDSTRRNLRVAVRTRLTMSLSSVISNNRRCSVLPDDRNRRVALRKAIEENDSSIVITYHENKGPTLIATSKLNDYELHAAAGKIMSPLVPNNKVIHDFAIAAKAIADRPK